MRRFVALAVAALVAAGVVRAIAERVPAVGERREAFGMYEVHVLDARTLAATVVRFEFRRDGTFAYDWYGLPSRDMRGHLDGRWEKVKPGGAEVAPRYRFVGHPSEPIRTVGGIAPDEYYDVLVHSPGELWARMVDFESRSISRGAFNVFRRLEP